MAIKVAFFALLLVLIVNAQTMRQPQDISGAQDPIGNYRLRVRGFLVGSQGDQPVADLQGYTERLNVKEFKTILTHSILQVSHPGSTESQGQGQQEMPVINLHTFERPDTVDFFANPATGMNDIGSCYYATIEAQQNDLQVGQWTRAKTKCGSSKNGNLWTRVVSFTDEEQRQIESIEAVCKGQDGRILWLETSQRADDQQIFATRLEVEDYGSEPSANQQGLASFSLPAVCIVQPEESRSAAEMLTNALSAMGIDLGGGLADHNNIQGGNIRGGNIRGGNIRGNLDRSNLDRSNLRGNNLGGRGLGNNIGNNVGGGYGHDDVVNEPYRGNEQRRPLQR